VVILIIQKWIIWENPVSLFQIINYFLIINYQNRASMSNDGVLHLVIPKASLSEISKEMVVYDLELSREDSAGVNVGCVGLNALIVAEDLGGGSSGHWSNQKRVADSMLLDLFTQFGPVPQLGAWINSPHVKLQDLERKIIILLMFLTKKF